VVKGESMWNEIGDVTGTLFGDVDTDLNALQMSMRAIVTFVVTVAVIRIGNKRLFGKGTAYDTVVAIMIGSVMSRAITASGSGTMLATWAAGLTLIAMHWLLSTLSYHVSWFGSVIKGHEVELVRDGQILEDGMRETGTTVRDLERAMRSDGNAPDTESIRMAYMERDGSISTVPKSSGPKVIEVDVRDGVQTVRIALD
jgi:uncharacterized membrane protein YcaP (DUF421 family)